MSNKYKKQDWKDSEYTSFIRIKKEKSEFLKKLKGRKTMAGFLDEIINFYRDKKNVIPRPKR